MPTSDELTIVHAADLHLGGRRWLRQAPSEREVAEQVRTADLRALSGLVDLCLAERASLLLLAGDVFDGWCRDHRVGLVLAAELTRLREVGAFTLLVLGNHDLRSPVTRPLLLPDAAVVLGAEAPETRLLPELGVAVHGWSHPRVAPGEDVVTRFPSPLPGWFNVGLLHTSAEGRAGHADYAPCSRRSLRAHGYDYWALGHVHQREVVSVDPYVVFPGNLQGRGAREPGPRGATVVRVHAGRVVGLSARAVDAVRFETVLVEVPGARHFDDLLARASVELGRARDGAGGRAVVVRLVFRGEESAAVALSVPPRSRGRALRAVGAAVGGGLQLDEAWLDGGELAFACPLDLSA